MPTAGIAPKTLPTLFQGTAPRLSRLCCIGLSPHLHNRFPNLTHLYLYEGSVFPGRGDHAATSWHGVHDATPFLPAFLDFLEGAPGLEELVLVHRSAASWCTCGKCRKDPEELAGRRVRMPRLRRITFGEYAWANAGRILRYVVPAKRVTVQTDGAEGHTGNFMYDVLSLLTPDAGFLGHLAGITEVALWLREGQHCRVTWYAVTLRREYPAMFVHAVAAALDLRRVVDLSVQMDSWGLLSVQDAQALFSSMPAVQRCTFWMDSRIHRSYWQRCLSKADVPFPDLRTLHFVCNMPKDWRPWEILGLAIRRAKRGRRLEEVKLTAVASEGSVPSFVRWDVDALQVGGKRLLDYVGSLRFEQVTITSLMKAPVLKHWDGCLL
ncbi:uncharacterized protein C8Q71DRAFT_863055 [Rhodofomes roseus]|uniref:Uncharacterized protein n=1 Tax=Rhodofomes roseus TaxID=34475 RepID=A0ABQ8JZD6_9APHY|nr:uncharacterized protein C8Q71DRAFT_863055 [Rhodofomes roseus]KAH9829676.1 hypothetical protein C8Q71DRAFT_863055 [Rhodofomes roseus]